jgi:membrane dipeptidase
MDGRARARGTIVGAALDVAFPEMRRGRVAVAFATLIARSTGRPSPHIDFATPEQAYGVAQGQLAYYRALERRGTVRLLRDAPALDAHTQEWKAWDARHPDDADGTESAPPLGFVVSMEGADPILDPKQLEEWWRGGLRLLGLTHYGPGRYAGGTGTEGRLTDLAAPLLSEIAHLGIALDLTHCSDRAFWQALDRFEGRVHASHSNCRAHAPHAADPQALG